MLFPCDATFVVEGVVPGVGRVAVATAAPAAAFAAANVAVATAADAAIDVRRSIGKLVL